MTQGKFITFEGGDGCGKTTQARLLFKALNDAGIVAILTREPGGTQGAEAIRDLLVTGETGRWDRMTETLLYFAARHDHVEKLIKPSLGRGEWVICDRFTMSTFAYQGYGHGLPLTSIEGLHKFSIGGFNPDITLIYDIDAKIAEERLSSRQASPKVESEDRYERMSDTFHKNVRRGFVEMANKNKEKCRVINANTSIVSIHQSTVQNVAQKFDIPLRAFSADGIKKILA